MAKRKRSSSAGSRRFKKTKFSFTPQRLSRRVNKSADIPVSVFAKFLRPFVNPNKVVRLARHGSFANIAGTAVGETTGALAFLLTDLAGYTDFTTLYDQYRFVAVEVKFIPVYPTYNAIAAATSQWGLMYTAIDYDDASPGSVALLRENATCLASHPTKEVIRRVVPHTAVAEYGAGAFTSYGNKIGDWIDSSSPGVAHYGVKYALQASVGTILPIFTVETIYCLEFRATH